MVLKSLDKQGLGTLEMPKTTATAIINQTEIS